MANSGNFNAGVRAVQQNPKVKQATPQQIPSSPVRQDYNAGVKKGKK